MFDPRPLVEMHGRGLRELARTLGVDPAVLCRPLSQWQADKFAIRSMGRHPFEVWGAEAWWGPLWAAEGDVAPSAMAA
jgi:hypothetical protein